jgi:hypothetical protein
MSVSRRLFLGHLFAAFAAPAIVRASSLMPVRTMLDLEDELRALWPGSFADHVGETTGLSAEMLAVTRQAFMPRLQVQTYKATPLMRELALRAIPVHEDPYCPDDTVYLLR